jgi:putative ATPase
LFVDEIHRFNKSQQDVFLPLVENGDIILIWATTENPSFEINKALLSRCQVLIFNSLTSKDLDELFSKIEKKNWKIKLSKADRERLIKSADWDGRYLVNFLVIIYDIYDWKVENLDEILVKKLTKYDKDWEEHYNLISALHKSVRGSDPEASLYYCCRILQWWDAKFLLRRMIRMSVEDIGLAMPTALMYANSTAEAYERLWTPEWDLAICELAVYLATCPKSNRVYEAYNLMKNFILETWSLPPPKHIINGVTSLMKKQWFWKWYIYDPDTKEWFSWQNYFPEWLKRTNFYNPTENWMEKEIKKRMEYWEKLWRE